MFSNFKNIKKKKLNNKKCVNVRKSFLSLLFSREYGITAQLVWDGQQVSGWRWFSCFQVYSLHWENNQATSVFSVAKVAIFTHKLHFYWLEYDDRLHENIDQTSNKVSVGLSNHTAKICSQLRYIIVSILSLNTKQNN